MSDQDTIISLLREIDKNIDNVNDSEGTNANLEELTITSNGEYVPAEGVDGFSKVTAEFDISIMPKVKVSMIRVKDTCLNENGEFIGAQNIDTSAATSLQDVFHACSKLKKLDISTWDVSNVTTIATMFQGCTSLEQLNVSGWNTSNIKLFLRPFNGIPCKIIDFISWDVSKAESMAGISGLFYGFNVISIVNGMTENDVISNGISALIGMKINCDVSNTQLDRASLRAIINGLADLTGQTAQTLTIGETLIAKLTEEDIAIATAKNWTLS